MEEMFDSLRQLQRHLNSVEHMVYVSYKFTKTSEMLRRIMESIVQGYELFLSISYRTLVNQQEYPTSYQDKILLLSQALAKQGISVDLSEYIFLKRLLLSEYGTVGEYRKNLCLLIYLDGEEQIINIASLLNFYENLKSVCNSLLAQEQ